MTEPDNGRHSRLTIKQQNAVDCLILGKTDQETADAVGVSRQTSTEWRNHHPYFIAELNRRRHALWEGAHRRLQALAGKGIDNLAQAVEVGDIKASLEILKASGLYGMISPAGSEDPRLIMREHAERWVDAELARLQPTDNPQMERLLAEVTGRRERLLAERFMALEAEWGSLDSRAQESQAR